MKKPSSSPSLSGFSLAELEAQITELAGQGRRSLIASGGHERAD